MCGGAGGGAGATNSSQFKVVGVANFVTRRASLMVMCLFTGFVRHGHHKNHKPYPVHDCFKSLSISLELIHDSKLVISMYNSGKMWLGLKFVNLVSSLKLAKFNSSSNINILPWEM